MVQGRTGIEFDLDRNAQTGQRSIDSTKTLHKFTLYFKDFYGKASTMTIARWANCNDTDRDLLNSRSTGNCRSVTTTFAAFPGMASSSL